MLVADDYEVVRRGLRAFLDGEEDLEVVADARDGRQAVELARTLRPDIVVADVAMPELDGFEAARQILADSPGTRIVLLSERADEALVRRAAELGAAGYVLKQAPLSQLAEAIRGAEPHRTFVAPTAEDLSRAAAPAGAVGPEMPASSAGLSPREREVLQLIAGGKANKESAKALGISVKTVEKHRQTLMAKLDIHDVAGLTRYALACGLVD